MREDWDRRARENARYYVNTASREWTDDEFFASGERTVAEEILTDMGNICQGRDPGRMRVLEIGCGAGRVTRALAKVFGEVWGVDISGEMIEQARPAWPACPTPTWPGTTARTSACSGDREFDFAFSSIVFQHIPSREVIENYVREVHRVLRPGGLFKFQVQGDPRWRAAPRIPGWGSPFSDRQAVEMAERCGFEPRHRHGAGEQYFWLWYFKNSAGENLAAGPMPILRSGPLRASLRFRAQYFFIRRRPAAALRRSSPCGPGASAPGLRLRKRRPGAALFQFLERGDYAIEPLTLLVKLPDRFVQVHLLADAASASRYACPILTRMRPAALLRNQALFREKRPVWYQMISVPGNGQVYDRAASSSTTIPAI